MYHHLLIPLDGSAAARRAIDPALALAGSLNAAIELVHVHDPAWLPHDGTPTLDPRFDQEQALDMRESLAATAADLRSRANVSIAATMLRGTPVDALREHVSAAGTDLVVMTTHGRSGFGRLRLGSVTDALVRGLSIPVLVLPSGGGDENAHGLPPYRHVLVPTDNSAFAGAAIQQAVALSATETSTYTLLNVVRPRPAIEPFPDIAGWVDAEGVATDQSGALKEDIEAASRQMEKTAAPLRRARISVSLATVAQSDPAAAILNYATAHEVDLIALVTRGRSWLANAMTGSVARAVVHGARIPVLVCRPDVEDDPTSD